MSDPHDERLSLPIEQGVLLWCMRAWVLEMRQPSGLEPRIHDMLDRFGVPRASADVGRFMSVLSQGAARMINVQCICCTRIGADEHALLDVFGLAQDMRPFEALLLLHGMVTRSARCAGVRRDGRHGHGRSRAVPAGARRGGAALRPGKHCWRPPARQRQRALMPSYTPGHDPPSAMPADAAPAETPVVTSGELLAGGRELVIQHGNDRYRLLLTAQNKLLLTK